MAGTIVVPATCPGDHVRTPDEVIVGGPLQLGGDSMWWTLGFDYGCDQCWQKHFGLILHEAPDEVRDYEGNAKRIVTQPPPPHPSDRAIREFAERNRTKDKRRRWGTNKKVERAKYIVVAAPPQDSDLFRSATEHAQTFTDADREEFNTWMAAYHRAEEVLASGGGTTSTPDTSRLAMLSPRAAADSLAQGVASNEAWLEAYADVGVSFNDDWSQEYVGVKEAKQRLADGRNPKRWGKEGSVEAAKRILIQHPEEASVTFDLFRAFSPDDFDEFAGWLQALQRAEELSQHATSIVASANEAAQRTGDVSEQMLADAVSAIVTWRLALAEIGVWLDEGGDQIYVGIKEAQRRIPDDPLDLARGLSR
jgi:hypothetical protein